MFLLLTAFAVDKTLLERRRDAARTLAMLSDEGSFLQRCGGTHILPDWTKPMS